MLGLFPPAAFAAAQSYGFNWKLKRALDEERRRVRETGYQIDETGVPSRISPPREEK